MAWLKMHHDLLQHPKLQRFARGLGIPEAAAAGHLFALWGWAMSYAPDGNLAGLQPDDIAGAAGWRGDAGKFLGAALECGIRGCGFLEKNDEGDLVLHEWDEHIGDRFEKLKKHAERMRAYRQRQHTTPKSDNGEARKHSVLSTCASRAHNVRCERRGEERRGDTPPIAPPGGGGACAGEPSPPNGQTPPTAKRQESLPAETPQDSGGARPNAGGKEADIPAGFDEFWAAYPRRVHKQPAVKAWRALAKQGATAADVTEAARAYAEAMGRKNTPPDKILHPATFLHDDRWRDWLPPDGASYREAMGAGRESPRPAERRGPMSYADAVARFHGAGAATVDLSPGEWTETPCCGAAEEAAK